MTDAPPNYDALLLLSFGGPEAPDDVMPFLENVTRGKRVPRERLLEVAEHYQHFGGKSPINDQCRALIDALGAELIEAGIDLPIYWGNRNWHPMLADTLRTMQRDGVERALCIVTSAFSSYSGCRQYLEDIERARAEVGEGAPELERVRVFYNHPGFLDTVAQQVTDALHELPPGRRDDARLAFTAHSIPLSMSDGCDYVAQLDEASAYVADKVGCAEYQLVYQSRSGPPHVPWLEPDIGDHLRALARIGGRDVVVVPIGFLSDHVEVVWDLDNEAMAIAEEEGIHMVRAATVGTHPHFVGMLRELVEERLGRVETRQVIPCSAPRPDVCAPGCCAYTPRRPGPPR